MFPRQLAALISLFIFLPPEISLNYFGGQSSTLKTYLLNFITHFKAFYARRFSGVFTLNYR